MRAVLMDEISQFIQDPDRGSFDELAAKVIKFQAGNNPALANYYQSKGFAPSSMKHWTEAPHLTTDAFKETSSPLITFPLAEASGHFLTSGTTQGRQGHHYHRSTGLYEHSILKGWEREKLPTQSLFFLTPPPSSAPHSSLIHMFETLNQSHNETADANCFLLDSEGRFHLEPLTEAIEKNTPLCLSGPAISFLELFKKHPSLSLPKGSQLLETGGYKGLKTTLSKEGFYHQLSDFFNLPEEQIINEYGMTELSTPAYTRGLSLPHQLPHWAKAFTYNSVTQSASKEGEVGYLCLFDLANIETVSVIRTQDLAISHDDHTFTLIGRDPKAIKRGCSLAAEELHAQ